MTKKSKTAKRISKLLQKPPTRRMTLFLLGAAIFVVGYVWARSTFDQDIATNNPNQSAGYVMLAGGLTSLVAVIGHTTSRRKKKSKK